MTLPSIWWLSDVPQPYTKRTMINAFNALRVYKDKAARQQHIQWAVQLHFELTLKWVADPEGQGVVSIVFLREMLLTVAQKYGPKLLPSEHSCIAKLVSDWDHAVAQVSSDTRGLTRANASHIDKVEAKTDANANALGRLRQEVEQMRAARPQVRSHTKKAAVLRREELRHVIVLAGGLARSRGGCACTIGAPTEGKNINLPVFLCVDHYSQIYPWSRNCNVSYFAFCYLSPISSRSSRHSHKR